MNDHGSAVVSKLLETLVALLYITVIAMLLFGSVVPAYQSTAGEELAERVLAETAAEIQDLSLEAKQEQRTVELPETINGEPYQISASEDQLELNHPSMQQTQPVVVQTAGPSVTGTWQSNESATLLIEYDQQTITITEDNAQ